MWLCRSHLVKLHIYVLVLTKTGQMNKNVEADDDSGWNAFFFYFYEILMEKQMRKKLQAEILCLLESHKK